MRNRLSDVIGIYTIRKPIFLCLKPSDIRRICDATDYKLSEPEEKTLMNPHDEICEDDTHPHTTLFTGDNLNIITDYNYVYKSLYMYDHIEFNIYENENMVKFRHTHIFRKNASIEHINMTDGDIILISNSISSPSEGRSSHVEGILNSYILTRAEFLTASRQKSNYETTQFSLPCAISTEKEWYHDILDIEFKDVTYPVSVINFMLNMLIISIRLRSNPKLFCFKQMYTTERTRAVLTSRSREIT